MSDYLKAMESGVFYHYFNRANNRENLFLEEANYWYFLDLMKKHLPPVADVYSYCLLPNHFHFVVRIKDDKDLPEAVRIGRQATSQPFSNLFNAYAKAINKRYARRGSLFQRNPKHFEITNNAYLREVILYVNNNSGHHNIAEPEQYPYSSYHSLLSSAKTLLARDKVWELFGGREDFERCLEDENRRIEIKQALLLEDDYD